MSWLQRQLYPVCFRLHRVSGFARLLLRNLEGRLPDNVRQDDLLARHLGASPPLNLCVRTAPRGADHFCWRIDVLPRLTHLAGLELSTDINLNIVAPEQAAALLREA